MPPDIFPVQRELFLQQREELACLLLGNLIYQPAPLPDKIAGLPSQLLLDMVANSTTLRASTRGRYSLWKELNSRAASSDSCEGTFASYHGSLGMKPDVITLLGRAITLDFEAHLRSLSEEERGFPLPEASKVYFARSAEDASNVGSWNGGQVLYDPSSRALYIAKVIKRVLTKIGQFKAVTEFYCYKGGWRGPPPMTA